MRAYLTSGTVNNPAVAPPVPVLRWSYEQREAQFGEKNPRFTHGRGRKRRQRREVDTRKGGEHRRAILEERATFDGADGVKRTWRELVYTALDGRPLFLLALQTRARKLMDQITAHGPASGWGVAQPIEDAQGNPKWTPFVVPKASEKCWRWWRSKRIELAKVLRALGWLWGKPIPPHRAPTDNPSTNQQPEPLPASEPCDPTGYRDRLPADARAVLERIRKKMGAPPVEGSEEGPIER